MDKDSLIATLRGFLSLLPVSRFRDPPPVVTVIRLNGVIGRLGSFGAGMTLSGLERDIERAFKPHNLVAVALAINSPGGSPVQSALIAHRIRALADEKQIPVIAFAEDIAASGGYWLACAADEIYANENSLVGSIGVITAGFGLPHMIRRLGIERRVLSSGRRKGMFDPFREERPEDVARLKSIQTDMHDTFKQMVRDRRGDRLNGSDEELFEGDIWTGSQARTLGLVDGLGELRDWTRERFGERVRLRPAIRPPGRFRRLLGGPAWSAGPAAQIGEALAALDEWWQWKRFGL